MKVTEITSRMSVSSVVVIDDVRIPGNVTIRSVDPKLSDRTVNRIRVERDVLYITTEEGEE